MSSSTTYSEQEQLYMRRCIQLARLGCGFVSPNPMVGAILVCGGRIIGEGFHAKVGEAHAEVNAIRSVADPLLLQQSTLYVSLEPCSHYGKTPPCADLIVRMGIPRVVVGCLDPFPQVSGRGIEKMRRHGVEVKVGLLKEECQQLLRPFATPIRNNRPYTIAKWAETADGFIDRIRTPNAPHQPTPISNEQERRAVHKLRSQIDAILVGTETAILDNPKLNVRYWSGKNPIRVVIDRHNRISASSALFDGSIATWVFTLQPSADRPNLRFIALPPNEESLPFVLRTLHQERIQTLLVEGGAQLLTSLIEGKWYDEIRIEKSNILFGNGVKAPEKPIQEPLSEPAYAE